MDLAAPAACVLSVARIRHQKSFRRVANGRRLFSVACKAATGNEPMRKQLDGVEVLTEMLKSTDKYKRAEELVDDMSQEFFRIASTYLSKARKEGNAEAVTQVELALKAAVTVKDKRLRPEIQLFNKLLRNNSSAERQLTIQENYQYLHEGSYFFEILENTMAEVEALNDKNPDKRKLLIQLRIIDKQTKNVANLLKESSSR